MKNAMKRILLLALAVVMAVGMGVLAACNNNTNDGKTSLTSLSIVAPDGAPALSIAKLINDNRNFAETTTYKVVNASDIKNYVVGNGEKADIALIPVNLASLLIGDGSEYKGVATVTHGNLYMLSLDETAIDKDNIASLKGKTVAVVNIANVPGLTFKAVLKDSGIEFTEDESQKTDENVYLIGINGSDIATTLNQSKADYVIAPEPAVSTITGKVPAIKKVAALHDIYGSYPQAVMVVKNRLLEENKDVVKQVFAAMQENESWIKENPALAAQAVASRLDEGETPSFTADNTTESSVEGCSIKMVTFTDSEIEIVKNYIDDIISFGTTSAVAKQFDDAFFVDINE